MFNLGNRQQMADNQNQTNSQFANQAFGEKTSFEQPRPTQKGLFQIPERYLQLIPALPLILEMFTGQKIPAMGAMADILSGVQQNQASLSRVINNQNQIWNKITGLENNASTQLTNLSQQVANTNKDFRILATETKKSLEFHGNNFEKVHQSRPELEPIEN